MVLAVLFFLASLAPPSHPLSSACSNFQAFICQSGDFPDVYSAFYDEALLHLEAYRSDFVTEQLQAAIDEGLFKKSALEECRHSIPATSEESFSEKEGFLIGFGLRSWPKIDVSTRDQTVKVVSSSAEKSRSFRTLPFESTPSSVQDLLRGYFLAVDIDGRFDVQDFNVTFEVEKRVTLEIDAPEEQETRRSSRHKEKGPFADILETPLASAYANLLYAHLLLSVDPNLVHNSTFDEELHSMAEEVKKGIFEHIDKTEWIKEETKRNIRELFPSERIYFGAPKEFSEEAMVAKAVDFFKETFQRFHNDSDLRERLGESHKTCRGLFFSQLLRLAHNAFKLQNDDYDFGMYPFQNQPLSALSFFQSNAFNYHSENLLLFGAPEIYGQHKELPDGFRYGTLGYTLAHEMFHSLGVDTVHVEGGEEIKEHSNYRKALDCYKEYYGGFKMWQCYDYFNGTKGCHLDRPDGSTKIDEGFADIQAARVVAKIAKTLDNGTSDAMDSFFFGLGANYCEEYKEERRNATSQRAHLRRGKHPRTAIRANAIVRQLKEYSGHFGCQKGHQMFHEEKLCDVFGDP